MVWGVRPGGYRDGEALQEILFLRGQEIEELPNFAGATRKE
jgi:hypothetical protein